MPDLKNLTFKNQEVIVYKPTTKKTENAFDQPLTDLDALIEVEVAKVGERCIKTKDGDKILVRKDMLKDILHNDLRQRYNIIYNEEIIFGWMD